MAEGIHSLAQIYDRSMRYLLIACAAAMTIMIGAIIVFVGQQGLMTFTEVSAAEFFFSDKWDPTEGQFGAFSFIFGSAATAALAVLFGAPIALAGAVFMAKIAPERVRSVMRPAVDLYVAIPSVVYGYIGLTVLVPMIREIFDTSVGFGLLAAGLVLAVMILPTIISISEDAIRAVPKSLEEASLALGATRWQTLRKVILPAAMPGILTSVILALARAVGETMAVQMVIGNTPLLASSLFMPTATLTSNIVVEMGNTPFGSAWGNSLFLMALVLLMMSLAMILIIRRIAKGREI